MTGLKWTGQVRALVDCFDHDAGEVPGRGAVHDEQVLSSARKVSVFWITETQARARRITQWIKTGRLVLDHSPGYPWCNIVRFDNDKT